MINPLTITRHLPFPHETLVCEAPMLDPIAWVGKIHTLHLHWCLHTTPLPTHIFSIDELLHALDLDSTRTKIERQCDYHQRQRAPSLIYSAALLPTFFSRSWAWVRKISKQVRFSFVLIRLSYLLTSSDPFKKTSRFLQMVSGVYAGTTWSGSFVFHSFWAALTFLWAISAVQGGTSDMTKWNSKVEESFNEMLRANHLNLTKITMENSNLTGCARIEVYPCVLERIGSIHMFTFFLKKKLLWPLCLLWLLCLLWPLCLLWSKIPPLVENTSYRILPTYTRKV